MAQDPNAVDPNFDPHSAPPTGRVLVREFKNVEELNNELSNLANQRIFIPVSNMDWKTGIETAVLLVIPGPQNDEPLEIIGEVLHVGEDGIVLALAEDIAEATSASFHRAGAGNVPRVDGTAPVEKTKDGTRILKRRFALEKTLAKEYMENLRHRRAFVRTAERPPIKARVRVDLELATDGRTFSFSGEVVYQKVNGVGIELDPLAAGPKIALQQMVKAHG